MKCGFAKGTCSHRRAEQGQTILLVAVSIVALLSMAALAIDVVTLYVAKSEIQRAADAVALAGAKAVADSGVTTLNGASANLGAAEIVAQNMATVAITAALSANMVNGQPPTLSAGGAINWSLGNNNPTITVTLQQTNLPTFFAKIFSRTSAMTQATATAEAYNPANTSPNTQIQEQCVKPWLMANCDPNSPIVNNVCTQQIVNPATGAVEDLIGQPVFLAADCNATQSHCSGGFLDDPPVDKGPLLKTVDYLPAQAGTTTIAPASCGTANPYQQSIAGCDPTPYTCGGGTTPIEFDPTENPENGPNSANNDVAEGTSCLVAGGDTLDYQTPWYDGPPQIRAGSPPLTNQLVSTSNAIVTIPIIQYCPPVPSGGCVTPNRSVEEVVGFLQGFIKSVGQNPNFATDQNHQADIQLIVMNVVGCSTTTNGNPPVTGGNGASTIPVRLITPP